MKIDKNQTVKWSKGSGLFCSKKKKHNCKVGKYKKYQVSLKSSKQRIPGNINLKVVLTQ